MACTGGCLTMYGVGQHWLRMDQYNTKSFKDIYREHYQTAHDIEIIDDDGNEIVIVLSFAIRDDEFWLGFRQQYPWHLGESGRQATPSLIKKAIIKFLTPYGYDPRDIEQNVDYIVRCDCN